MGVNAMAANVSAGKERNDRPVEYPEGTRQWAAQRLLAELDKGWRSGEEQGWRSLEEVKAALDEAGRAQ